MLVKVGVVGYGVIGLRLAEGVALQKDMELVGVADVGPTLSVRALAERGMPYDLPGRTRKQGSCGSSRCESIWHS